MFITPLIIRKVGIENFGTICYLQALFLTLNVVTDWGFNISSIRDIAQIKQSTALLNKLVNNIFFSKITLLIGVLVCVSIGLLFVDQNMVYFLVFPLLIGMTIFPAWVILGLEENHMLIIGSLIRNIVYAFCIYFLIKIPADFEYLLFYQGMAYIVASIILFIYIFQAKDIKLSLSTFSLKKSKTLIEKNNSLFFSNFSLTGSQHAVILILKFYISEYMLGVYGIAIKIASISKLGLTVFNTSIYPRVCVIVSEKSKDSFNFLIKKIYFPIVGIYLLALCLIAFTIPYVLYYLEPSFDKSNFIYVYTIFAIPAITLFNIIPSLMLLAKKKDKEYAKISIESAFLSVGLLIFLTPFYGLWGAIFSSIFVELFLVFRFYQKAKIYL